MPLISNCVTEYERNKWRMQDKDPRFNPKLQKAAEWAAIGVVIYLIFR